MAGRHSIDLADQPPSLTPSHGIPGLTSIHQHLDSKLIAYQNPALINFNSDSYLGLHHDDRIIQACLTSLQQYAEQPYTPAIDETESLLAQLFDQPCLLTATVAEAHTLALPAITRSGDLIVLDHQSPDAIRNASRLIKAHGNQIEMIRHNDLNQLEQLIRSHRQRKARIWYCISGIYYLYGNNAPINELFQLLDRYPEFYLYADDSYGLSWCGQQGRGSIRGDHPQHPQLVLTAALNKAFASAGGLLILPDNAMRHNICTHREQTELCSPVYASLMAALNASTRIHLSGEIELAQIALKERIDYCLKLIAQYQLADISAPGSPIFHIAIGEDSAAIQLAKLLRDDGFMTTAVVYPSVPFGHSGIRFSLTNQHSFNDIDHLLTAISHHYPQVLTNHQHCVDAVVHTIQLTSTQTDYCIQHPPDSSETDFCIDVYDSIQQLENEWRQPDLFKGYIGVSNLRLLEQIFAVQQPDQVDHNHWLFKYLTIRDQHGHIVLMTLMTVCDIKTDMYLAPQLSELAEQQRRRQPEAFVSRSLLLGTPMSEGQHLYLDEQHPLHKQALDQFLQFSKNLQSQYQAEMLILKAFSKGHWIVDYISTQGFLSTPLPDDHYLDKTTGFGSEQFLRGLKKDYRRHWKNKVLPFIDRYTLHQVTSIDQDKLEHHYRMYLNHQQGATEIATFSLPTELLTQSVNQQYWSCLELRYDDICVACMYFFADKEELFFMVLGTDSEYKKYGVYRACLYYAGKYAQQLGLKKINYGLTASLEKRRIGATAKSVVALIRTVDNYQIDALNML